MSWRGTLAALALGALLAAGGRCPAAAQDAAAAQNAAPATSPGWAATDEVIYQVFVRSFRDSDGDRIGDLRGIEQSLPYLQELGVTSLLLTPICPSPFYHNYFCTSFEAVEPAYGDERAWRSLVRAVHARRMKIYLDVEDQYVAQGHPWWTESQGQPASPYGRYLIYHGPGNTQPATAVFDITGAPAYDGRQVGITTVNLRASVVEAYFQRLFLGLADPNGSLRDGVDGFRLDHMMDDLDGKPELRGLFAHFWAPIMAKVRAANPRVRFLAEQADWGPGDDWLTRGGADRVFAFPLQRAIAALNRDSIAAAIQAMARTPAGKGRIVFIENHDVERFASRVGGDGASARKERLGAALDLLLQGTPLIYYGQELGMKGKATSSWGWGFSDIPQREAMRWTAREEDPGSAIWYKGAGAWWAGRFNRDGDGVSVAEEENDPASLLSFYRRLIALRRARPELRDGDERVLATDCPDVLAVLRSTPRQASLLLVNLGERAQRVTVARPVPATMDGRLRDLISGDVVTSTAVPLTPFAVRLLARP